jgi:hypothetical protein
VQPGNRGPMRAGGSTAARRGGSGGPCRGRGADAGLTTGFLRDFLRRHGRGHPGATAGATPAPPGPLTAPPRRD